MPLLAGILASCGEEPVTLEAKQKELLAKKAELRELSTAISTLEKEIATLDPNTAARNKVAFVGIQEVKTADFDHFIDVQGQIEAKQNVSVSALTSGRLAGVYVKEGQFVKRGQLLAKVDDGIIQASINEVQSNLDLAKDLLARQQRLWDQGIGTEVQLLEAKNRVEGLNKRLATQAEQRALTKIVSPISGTVEEIMPKTGELVSPGFPAFRIVNNNDLSLMAKLSESYVPRVSKGDQVVVEFPTLDKEINARVTVIGQTIHPNDRTFDVEVALPSDAMLKPNMFGTLRINDQKVSDAVVLPLDMVQQSELGPFIYVATETGESWKAERRNLTIGLTYKDQITVTEGLKPGELLITSGYNDLSSGQVVEFDAAVAGN